MSHAMSRIVADPSTFYGSLLRLLRATTGITLEPRPGVILGFGHGAGAKAPCRPPEPVIRLWEDPLEAGTYRLVTGHGFRKRMETLDRTSAAALLGPIPGGLAAMRVAFGLPRRRRNPAKQAARVDPRAA